MSRGFFRLATHLLNVHRIVLLLVYLNGEISFSAFSLPSAARHDGNAQSICGLFLIFACSCWPAPTYSLTHEPLLMRSEMRRRKEGREKKKKERGESGIPFKAFRTRAWYVSYSGFLGGPPTYLPAVLRHVYHSLPICVNPRYPLLAANLTDLTQKINCKESDLFS